MPEWPKIFGKQEQIPPPVLFRDEQHGLRDKPLAEVHDHLSLRHSIQTAGKSELAWVLDKKNAQDQKVALYKDGRAYWFFGAGDDYRVPYVIWSQERQKFVKTTAERHSTSKRWTNQDVMLIKG